MYDVLLVIYSFFRGNVEYCYLFAIHMVGI